jgi:hypothetical protein
MSLAVPSAGSGRVKKSGIAETSVREIARLRRTASSISELLHELFRRRNRCSGRGRGVGPGARA